MQYDILSLSFALLQTQNNRHIFPPAQFGYHSNCNIWNIQQALWSNNIVVIILIDICKASDICSFELIMKQDYCGTCIMELNLDKWFSHSVFTDTSSDRYMLLLGYVSNHAGLTWSSYHIYIKDFYDIV